MDNKVNLNKNVFNKSDFIRTLDTSFNQILVPSDLVIPTITIEEFFNYYESLFYEIPKLGDSNSHEYLITKSSEYINFEKSNEELQSLLDEITELRQENLDLNKLNYDLQISLSKNKINELGIPNSSPSLTLKNQTSYSKI
jgi:hypothetical protein